MALPFGAEPSVLMPMLWALVMPAISSTVINARSFFHNYLLFSFLARIASFTAFAFCLLTIFFPVCCSIFFLVSPAISPPFLAIFLLSSNVIGYFPCLFQ